MMDGVTLSQILGALRDTYQGIDIRALLAKAESGWTCAFLKIRPTNESRSEVEAKYAGKNQNLGEIRNESVRIEMEYRPISELDTLLSQVQSNSVAINGISATLKSTAQNIHINKTLEDDGFSTGSERAGFPHVFLNNPMEMSAKNYLKSLGITGLGQGRDFEESYPYFDSRSMDSSSVVILFPVYCKKTEVPFDERTKTLSRYEIHQALLHNVNVRVSLVTNSAIEYIERPSLSPKDLKPSGLCNIDVPMLRRQLSPNSHVSVEIRNDSLGKIAAEVRMAYDLKEILRHDDPLIEVLSLFELAKNLSQSLSSQKENPQLASTMVVLSLLGFRCIPLGLAEKSHEKIVESKVEKGSADILAYNQDLKVMLIIDCTTTIPNDVKLGRIRNTANEIKAKVGTDVIPTVVASVDSSAAIPKAKALSVLLIDVKCTEQLANLALSGQKQAGITLIRGYITNAISSGTSSI